MFIRRACADDSSELTRLRWLLRMEEADPAGERFEEFSKTFGSFLENALPSDRWHIWVAEGDGRVVGNVYLELVQRVPSPTGESSVYGYVTNFYVDQVSRNHGIGSRLLRALIDYSRDANLHELIVWPSERSRNCYQRVGFSPNTDMMELQLENGDG